MRYEYSIGVIGDVMLDVWLSGIAARLSPEAPVPDISDIEDRMSLGGAGNVAANITALGASCTLYTAIGGAVNGYSVSDIMHLCNKSRISLKHISTTDRCLTCKIRIMANGVQVCRLSRESSADIPQPIQEQLQASIEAHDAIILESYDKGVLTSSVIRHILNMGVPVMVDPKHKHWTEYQGATIFKPNEKEMRAAEGLLQPVTEHAVVTLGNRGMLVDGVQIPAHKVDVADATGAGDTAIAMLTLEYLRTGEIMEAAKMANLACSIVVQKHGTAQVSIQELSDAAYKLDEADQQNGNRQ